MLTPAAFAAPVAAVSVPGAPVLVGMPVLGVVVGLPSLPAVVVAAVAVAVTAVVGPPVCRVIVVAGEGMRGGGSGIRNGVGWRNTHKESQNGVEDHTEWFGVED